MSLWPLTLDSRERLLPERAPEWCTVVGYLGDSLAALGMAQHLVRHLRLERVGLLIVGTEADTVAALAREQPWVRETREVLISNGEHAQLAREATEALLDPQRPAMWLHRWWPEISPETVALTHLDFSGRRYREADLARSEGIRLPEAPQVRGAELLAEWD